MDRRCKDFMSEALTVMQWPLLACLLLPGMLVYLGLHIVRREVIFVDLALAQVATLGTCVSMLMGHEPADWQSYMWSFAFTLIGAAIFAATRMKNHHSVPQEALIGITYVVAAAAGILLLSRTAEGNEELRRTLIGDVLLVSQKDVLRTFAVYLVIGVVHFVFRKKFLAISFDPGKAAASGMAVKWWDFLFYALFGLVVTSFVQIGGVLLVFSYLIVPAVCANYLATRVSALLAIGWITATMASVLGLYAAYRMDLPTGAAIVCVLGITLILAATVAKFRKQNSDGELQH
jgi:zinc/manganese transport system permease protein